MIYICSIYTCIKPFIIIGLCLDVMTLSIYIVGLRFAILMECYTLVRQRTATPMSVSCSRQQSPVANATMHDIEELVSPHQVTFI